MSGLSQRDLLALAHIHRVGAAPLDRDTYTRLERAGLAERDARAARQRNSATVLCRITETGRKFFAVLP